MIAMVPPSSPSGVLRYQLIDRHGVTRELSRDYSPRLFIEAGSVGFGAPSFDISDSKRPFSPGKFVRQINTNERILELPIFIYEDSIGDLVTAVEDLYDWFFSGDENSQDPITFRVTRPDNTVRQVRGYFIEGFEGNMADGSPNWTKYTVRVYIPEPYPTAAVEETVTLMSTEGIDLPIMNVGDVDAYPVWVFTGPFININVSDMDLFIHFFTSSLVVTAGQTATFDTRPSDIRPGLSAYDQAGNSILATMVSTSIFWPLRPGLTNARVEYGANATAATGVTMTYLPRYRSLLR